MTSSTSSTATALSAGKQGGRLFVPQTLGGGSSVAAEWDAARKTSTRGGVSASGSAPPVTGGPEPEAGTSQATSSTSSPNSRKGDECVKNGDDGEDVLVAARSPGIGAASSARESEGDPPAPENNTDGGPGVVILPAGAEPTTTWATALSPGGVASGEREQLLLAEREMDALTMRNPAEMNLTGAQRAAGREGDK